MLIWTFRQKSHKNQQQWKPVSDRFSFFFFVEKKNGNKECQNDIPKKMLTYPCSVVRQYLLMVIFHVAVENNFFYRHKVYTMAKMQHLYGIQYTEYV